MILRLSLFLTSLDRAASSVGAVGVSPGKGGSGPCTSGAFPACGSAANEGCGRVIKPATANDKTINFLNLKVMIPNP